MAENQDGQEKSQEPTAKRIQDARRKGQVPRWLTEGFSVYEERQRDPTWERGMDRELHSAR